MGAVLEGLSAHGLVIEPEGRGSGSSPATFMSDSGATSVAIPTRIRMIVSLENAKRSGIDAHEFVPVFLRKSRKPRPAYAG